MELAIKLPVRCLHYSIVRCLLFKIASVLAILQSVKQFGFPDSIFLGCDNLFFVKVRQTFYFGEDSCVIIFYPSSGRSILRRNCGGDLTARFLPNDVTLLRNRFRRASLGINMVDPLEARQWYRTMLARQDQALTASLLLGESGNHMGLRVVNGHMTVRDNC